MDQAAARNELAMDWNTNSRWKGINRPYTPEEVLRLRGSFKIEYTLASMGASRLWQLLNEENYIHALSAVTGNQAIQQVRAGLKSIYVSGWQVAADMNEAQSMYPDQSLYPSDSVPFQIRRINNALLRADQIHHIKGDDSDYWLAPIVADAEAGFGGTLHAFELMQHMIREGAAGVHFEDQLASVKKCGHLGGKVLIPTREFVTKLIAARLAADVMGVPTILIARTDANSAGLLTSDADAADHEFITGERSPEGFFHVRKGIGQAISRGLAYAPHADLLWMETGTPDLDEAREFADAIHKKFPGKMLAYNCSPSFNWREKLTPNAIASFQQALGKMGYRYQFVTLSGFHSLNHSMYELATAYHDEGMAAYSKLQEREFESETDGYEAIRHQEFAGTGYFDAVNEAASNGETSTLGMNGSTEEEQF
ncbi:MAG: isocitrate lyase [bacterium]|nr:isocitrate lyase [bacterium]